MKINILNQYKNNNIKAFTLIEIMIVVAIIGILVALALPNYLEHLRKSRRADAIEALQATMLLQQNFRAQRLTFTTTLGAGAGNLGMTPTGGLFISPEGWYSLTAATCNAPAPNNNIANCVLLTATRIAGQRQANDPCGDFTLDSRGDRDIVNPAAGYNAARCWP